jgi:hypothetical protein
MTDVLRDPLIVERTGDITFPGYRVPLVTTQVPPKLP